MKNNNEKTHPCAECKMRNKYEQNPKSLISRFWHWHISFCPGWKRYYKSLSLKEQEELRKKYNLK